MDKFDRNRIKEGHELFEKIKESIVFDPNNLKQQFSNINCPKWFIEMGENYNLFEVKKGHKFNNYNLYLSVKGRGLYSNGGFERFYKEEVIQPRDIGKYEFKLKKYWWLPIVISVVSLILSFVSLFTRK